MSKEKGVVYGIQEIMRDPQVSAQILRVYLSQLHINLYNSEKLLGRQFWYITWCTVAFFLLDSGLIPEIILHGTELKRTGIVMLSGPLLIAFWSYRSQTLATFVGNGRSALATFYAEEKEDFYLYGLDMLTLYPSTRNMESFEGLVPGYGQITRKMGRLTTIIVTLIMVIGPVASVTYCLYRTWHYSDLNRLTWWIGTLSCCLIMIRSIIYGSGQLSNRRDTFSHRILKGGDNLEDI